MSRSLRQLILTSYVVLPFTICIISNAFASICLENQRKCLSMHLLHLVLIILIVFCMGCRTTSLTNWRRVLNASARLVCNAPRFCHISPILRGLHWLPVKARIKFKILLITFKAINGLAPKYLRKLLTFKSSLCNLRSSGSVLLSMPAVRSKTLGDRAFMVAAPRLWNSLPKELRAITNVNSFKAHIKTYRFRALYWWAILYSVLTCMHIYSFHFSFFLFFYFFIFKCIIFY